MVRKLVVCVMLTIFVSTGFAAESKNNKDSKKEKDQPIAKIQLPPKAVSYTHLTLPTTPYV